MSSQVLGAWLRQQRESRLFGPMIEALPETGVAEPFLRAFDCGSYCLNVADLADLLQTAGFRDVSVQTVELDATWPTAEAPIPEALKITRTTRPRRYDRGAAVHTISRCITE